MNEMPYDHPDGILPRSPLHTEELEQQGYQPCRNQLCDHMHSSDTLTDVYEQGGKDGVHECGHCGLAQTPHKRPGTPGGGTNAGISMEEQSAIGEELVHGMGEISGYGRIAWWHSGAAAGSNSALDGATVEWGIEVKSYNWTNVRKRGIINAKDKVRKAQAVNDPQLFAREVNDPKLNKVLDKLQFKGLLGILVLLDFETGLADVFGTEMAKGANGTLAPSDVKHITRKFSIAEDVPFTHSLPDPRGADHVPAFAQKPPENDWGF